MRFAKTWLTALLPLLMACEEKFAIDFDPFATDNKELVIFGLIHQGSGPYYVHIENVKKLSTDRTVISGARVELHNDIGHFEDCFEQSAGTYWCSGAIVRGIPGRSYHIIVTLADGERYFSTPDKMPEVFGGNFKVHWEERWVTETSSLGIDTQKKVVDFSLDADIPDSDGTVFLYWWAEELYQYLQKRQLMPFQSPPPCYHYGDLGLGRFELLSGADFIGTSHHINHIVQRDIDETFLRKHIFSFYQSSVSESYFRYLSDLKDLVENVGSIFDPPKGRPRGNIYAQDEGIKNANGYFGAIVIDTIHLAIYPDQLDAQVNEVCGSYNDTRCYNCEEIGGTFYRPVLYDQVK